MQTFMQKVVSPEWLDKQLEAIMFTQSTFPENKEKYE